MSSALQAMGLPGEILITQVDAKVGGSFCFSDRRPMGEAVHWGRYRQFNRPNVLAFSWNAGLQRTNTDDPLSLVTITLTNNTRGCDVSLTHSMDAQWRDYLQRTENGWRNMLVHIDAYLTGLQTTVR